MQEKIVSQTFAGIGGAIDQGGLPTKNFRTWTYLSGGSFFFQRLTGGLLAACWRLADGALAACWRSAGGGAGGGAGLAAAAAGRELGAEAGPAVATVP